jgi:hypothetical protein
MQRMTEERWAVLLSVEEGFSTIHEIAKESYCSLSQTYYYLHTLRELGCIKWKCIGDGSVYLTPFGEEVLNMMYFTVVLQMRDPKEVRLSKYCCR